MSESPSREADGKTSNRLYFEGFDGLRALAILPVLWHHSTPRVLPGVLGKGAVGVDLFFALSGFLITSLLLDERKRKGSIDLGAFHLRRFSRILPLYFVVLGVHLVGALATSGKPSSAHFLRSLWSHATFTSNLFVDYSVSHPIVMAFSWSLAVEMQFYLMWATIVRVVRDRLALALVLAALAGFDYAVEHRFIFPTIPREETLFRFFSSFSLPIGAGSFVALLLDEPKFPGTKSAFRFPLLSCVALGVATHALTLPATDYPLLCGALGLLVGSVAETGGGFLSPLLRLPLMARLGVLSYAIYLTHLWPIGIVRKLFPGLVEHPVLLFLAVLPVAFFLGELLHRTVERPAQNRLRTKFFRATKTYGDHPS